MPEPRLLLCTDMDRTVIPNGRAPEDAEARPRLRAFCGRPDVTLVYVTGRDRRLVESALETHALPKPDFVVSDVGTMIYRVADGAWSEWTAWSDTLAQVWPDGTASRVAERLGAGGALTLQEAERQNRFKVSFYGSAQDAPEALLAPARASLEAAGIRANLVYSVDEEAQQGLLDVVPAGGTKRHALEFLCGALSYTPADVVFGGDSGNDVPMAESEVPFVLVANAADAIKAEARRLADASGHVSSLYLAQGGRLNMNGNYAAGLLEGVWHFMPAYRAALEEEGVVT